jgi:hypothetical protein
MQHYTFYLCCHTRGATSCMKCVFKPQKNALSYMRPSGKPRGIDQTMSEMGPSGPSGQNDWL